MWTLAKRGDVHCVYRWIKAFRATLSNLRVRGLAGAEVWPLETTRLLWQKKGEGKHAWRSGGEQCKDIGEGCFVSAPALSFAFSPSFSGRFCSCKVFEVLLDISKRDFSRMYNRKEDYLVRFVNGPSKLHSLPKLIHLQSNFFFLPFGITWESVSFHGLTQTFPPICLKF